MLPSAANVLWEDMKSNLPVNKRVSQKQAQRKHATNSHATQTYQLHMPRRTPKHRHCHRSLLDCPCTLLHIWGCKCPRPYGPRIQ